VKEIFTSRLNQDCLESFFSWIRSSGLTYTTPTALDFCYRFKKYMLSKSTNHFAEKTNCKPDSAQNLCSELLLTVDEPSSSLSGEALSELVEGEEDDVEQESDGNSFNIPDILPQSHHMSSTHQQAISNLTKSNGILAMATYLAKQYP